jgi:hypothetical protein
MSLSYLFDDSDKDIILQILINFLGGFGIVQIHFKTMIVDK